MGKMKFKILHTNDIHSNFENFTKIVTKIKEIRDENTIVLDAGDFYDFKDVMLQGTDGQAGSELIYSAGYDAITIGNNEAFVGIEVLGSMTQNSKVPFLSCNLLKLDGTEIEGVKRSIIIEKSGIRFLVIGTSPIFHTFLELNGMKVLDYKDEIEKELKSNKGNYDVSILLSHLGLIEDTDIAETMNRIDIIIDGHSHKLMSEPEFIKNTVIHMSGCYGKHLGIVELEYDKGIKSINGINMEVSKEACDEETMEIIKRNRRIADENLSVPLYTIDRDMWHDIVEENPITNLLADALKDVLNCDLGLINSGIMNSGIRKGKVSFKKLIEICPSPLNPTYMEIKGKYLRKALEESLDSYNCYKDGSGSGFRGRFLGKLHVSGAAIRHNGKTIQSILINGNEIEDERYYTVATSDYLQRGTGYEALANNRNENYNAEYLRITLRDYLCKKEFIKKAFEDRWVME